MIYKYMYTNDRRPWGILQSVELIWWTNPRYLLPVIMNEWHLGVSVFPGAAAGLTPQFYGAQNAMVMSSWRSAYDGFQRTSPYGETYLGTYCHHFLLLKHFYLPIQVLRYHLERLILMTYSTLTEHKMLALRIVFF